MPRQYYVYILRCSDDSYYTGITNNLERRIAEHQSGLNKTAHTYKRRPVTLVFSKTFDRPMKAINFEKQVKGWRREKKEALINGRYDLLPALANTRKR